MKTSVGYWMTSKLIKVDKSENIGTAESIMRLEAINHLLVFDEGNLSGILSDNDLQLAEKIRERLQNSSPTPVITVGDLMSRHPLTISKDLPMKDAIRMMREKKFRSLPVVDEQHVVVGILTQTDVMRYALVASQNLERHEPYSKVIGGE